MALDPLPRWRARVLVFGLLLVLLVAVMVAGARPAGAATYYTSCTASGGIDPAVTQACVAENERLAAVVVELETLNAALTAGSDSIKLAANSDGNIISLDGDSADRLDLAGIGIWFLAGIALMALLAPMMTRAFRWWQD